MLDVDQIVIRGVRPAEHREPLRVLLPGELAAVDDDAAERRAVPTHVLRQRMHHDVRAVIDRSQQNGRCDRIVDDQRNAVFVRHASKGLDVANVSSRIADALAKDRPRVVIDQPFDSIRLIRLGKSDSDALTW